MISEDGSNLIFLLGLPRSGTTLLSVMLNNHEAVDCPPEPWLMLALEAIGRAPVEHPGDAAVLHYAIKEFQDEQITLESARAYATRAYNLRLQRSGKSVFVDKTPRYYHILPYLKKVFPAARYLVLLRNPLDVAQSVRSTWQFDLPDLLRRRDDHLASVDFVVGNHVMRQFLQAADTHACVVRYEELVREPIQQMERVVRELQLLSVDSAKLASFDVARSDFARSSLGDRQVLKTHEVHRGSIDTWQSRFVGDEIKTLLDAIGPTLLRDLGYASTLDVAAGMGIEVPADDTTHQAHLDRLERSLQRRRDAYESSVSFCDLAQLQVQLGQILSPGATDDPIEPRELLRRRIDQARGLWTFYDQAVAESKDLKTARETLTTTLHDVKDHDQHLLAELQQVRAELDLIRADRQQLQGVVADLSGRVDSLSMQKAAVDADLLKFRVELRGTHEQLVQSRGQVEEYRSDLERMSKSRSLRLGWALGLVPRPLSHAPAAAKSADTNGRAVSPPEPVRESTLMSLALKHLAAKGFDPEVILDVGAAKGYWSEETHWLYFPKAHYDMIDPLQESEHHLKELAARGHFSYVLCAVGREEGSAVMNVSADCDGSSLLLFPNSNPNQQRTVPIRTIDNLLAEGKIRPPQLVKMDVQGFEVEALEGGQKLFDTAEVFIIEVSLFEFLPRNPLMIDVITYMASKGYRLFDLAGTLRRPFENDLSQMDIVFVKSTSALVSSNRWM